MLSAGPTRTRKGRDSVSPNRRKRIVSAPRPTTATATSEFAIAKFRHSETSAMHTMHAEASSTHRTVSRGCLSVVPSGEPSGSHATVNWPSLSLSPSNAELSPDSDVEVGPEGAIGVIPLRGRRDTAAAIAKHAPPTTKAKSLSTNLTAARPCRVGPRSMSMALPSILTEKDVCSLLIDKVKDLVRGSQEPPVERHLECGLRA